jgi:hypothetical protein
MKQDKEQYSQPMIEKHELLRDITAVASQVCRECEIPK